MIHNGAIDTAGMSSEQELDHQQRRARAMGGAGKIANRAGAGLRNARVRIEALLDAGSFYETGLLGVSSDNRDTTPADGKITGYVTVGNRHDAVVPNDFTVKGAPDVPLAHYLLTRRTGPIRTDKGDISKWPKSKYCHRLLDRSVKWNVLSGRTCPKATCCSLWNP